VMNILDIRGDETITLSEVIALAVLMITIVLSVVALIITILFSSVHEVEHLPVLAKGCLVLQKWMLTLSLFAFADLFYNRRIRRIRRSAG